MAFRFTLPATHACHYLALAVGIFAGFLTMVATQSTGNYTVPTASISENIIDFPWRYTFVNENWLS
jgi:hypothetical protein